MNETSRKLSRRDFLKVSGAVGGVLAFGPKTIARAAGMLDANEVGYTINPETGSLCGMRTAELGIGYPNYPARIEPLVNKHGDSWAKGIVMRELDQHVRRRGLQLKDYSLQEITQTGDGDGFLGQNASRSEVGIPVARIMTATGTERAMLLVRRRDGVRDYLDAPTRQELTKDVDGVTTMWRPIQIDAKYAKPGDYSDEGYTAMFAVLNGQREMVARLGVASWEWNLGMFKLPSGMQKWTPISREDGNNPFFIR
jgi:hypothetical protein